MHLVAQAQSATTKRPLPKLGCAKCHYKAVGCKQCRDLLAAAQARIQYKYYMTLPDDRLISRIEGEICYLSGNSAGLIGTVGCLLPARLLRPSCALLRLCGLLNLLLLLFCMDVLLFRPSSLSLVQGMAATKADHKPQAATKAASKPAAQPLANPQTAVPPVADSAAGHKAEPCTKCRKGRPCLQCRALRAAAQVLPSGCITQTLHTS